MSSPYDETLEGETLNRRPPGPRHELICGRLHSSVQASIQNLTSTRLLSRRAPVQLSPRNKFCPDLSLIAVATGKLWLAAEIVNTEDHRVDTVLKKQIYEDLKLARVWMIDPRYDNVEIYHASQYGMVLKHILAGRELLRENLLPEFELKVAELFAPA